MKIMFVGSIRGKSAYLSAMKKIAQILRNDGHQVIHEHITAMTQQQLDSMTPEADQNFHEKILSDIKSSDIVISECSNQSLSVGYLLSFASDLGRPIIIFYHEDSPEPNLFPTLTQSSKIFLVKYSSETELEELTMEYMDFAKDQVDVRFNFFISPSIGSYLDWISKNKKVPRSVYLRNLIQKDMEENEEYR